MEHKVPETIKGAFRSERLYYKAIDSTDETIRAFFADEVLNDPELMTLGLGDLLLPKTKKDTEKFVEMLTQTLLNVMLYERSPSEKTTAEATPAPTDGDNNMSSTTTTPTSPPPPPPLPKPIGFLCLRRIDPSMMQHRSSAISLCIAAPHQGKGYGPEAINWTLDWGFKRANLHSIAIGTVSYNTRAIRAYEKLGFVFEGRDRQRIWFEREWYDMINYSMLEHEWEALRGLDKGALKK